MTLHEIVKAKENNEIVWYTDNDGEEFEAEIESICDDGNIIVAINGVDRIRVSPEELNY